MKTIFSCSCLVALLLISRISHAAEPPPQLFGIGKAGTITLDGKLADWPTDATTILLGRAADTAPRPGKWNGTPDASAAIRLAWGTDGLYIAADVVDDKVLQALPSGAEPWEGDTLELFLNIHPGPQRQGGFWQVALIPPLTPDSKFTVISPQGEFPNVEGEAEVHPNGYTFECRIPWENLPGFQPNLNTKLGVQLILNDRDLAKGRKSLLCWYPSATTYVYPTHVNLVELRDKGDGAGADFIAGPATSAVATPKKMQISILTTNTNAVTAQIAAAEPTKMRLQAVGSNLVAGRNEVPINGQGSTVFPVELLDANGAVVSKGEFTTDLIGDTYSEVRERSKSLEERLKAPELAGANPQALAGLGFWQKRINAILANEGRPESVSMEMAKQLLVEVNALDAAVGSLEKDPASDPYFSLRGSFVMAYRSPLTGEFRPHALYVPPDYDSKKPIPLIVLLHGIFGDERALFELTNTIKDCGAIVYQAASYRQFDWADISAAETWEGLSEIQYSRYKIDPDRVSLVGWHNGGRGVLQLAIAHPNNFSVIAPLFSGIDTTPAYPALRLYPQFYQKAAADVLIPFPTYKIPEKPKAISDPLERKIMEQLSLATRAENIIGLPIHMTEGEANPNAAAERLALLERLAELGSPVETKYVPGAQHGSRPPEIEDPAFYKWLAAQKRRPTPEEFTYVVTHLRQRSTPFVCVDGLISPSEPARIVVNRKEGNLSLITTGASALTLLTQTFLENGKSDGITKITIDGQTLPPMAQPKDGMSGFITTVVRNKEGRWQLGSMPPGEKRPGLSGPIDDFQFDRFTYVYGTADESGALAQEKLARKIANRGLGAEFKYKADRDVTPEEMENTNLVLIGSPSNNLLLAKMADSLPLKWEDNGLRLGSNGVTGTGEGACLIYPNPLAKNRYIVVVTGKDEKALESAWKQRAGVDYVLVQGSPEELQVAKGLFDSNWQFSDALNLPLRPLQTTPK